MSLVCGQCSRVNPAEAAYCFYDGAALAGRSSGPVNAGSAPFPNQFVFPNGTACRNFDQLALACQQNWTAALDLLQKGFLGSFFGGLGRVDLAMAAQEAAKFPDVERGLDQLLAKLPTQALQAPKLQAEPTSINLGQIKIGEDRATELHLTNLGMRLLYGSVVSDCKWLTIGDAPGNPEKIFQFGAEAILPIHVRGQQLRAGNKPLEGQLVIDSNGGTTTVTVRADVPITPFKGGLFDGAVTPRKIAEKAKATPKDAVSYFEGGAVAKWYASNGWAYPVQGPTMPGTGAIQQFFEALGVAKAPKVEFSVKEFDLQGAVGHALETKIEISTTERKLVYGWATCDQPWVEIGKTKLTGKTAIVPITIRVPSPAPPHLEAKLNVIGNGNQKAMVPLKVTVAGGKKGVTLETPPAPVEAANAAPVVLEIADKPIKADVELVQPPSAPFAFSEAIAQNVASPAADENPFAVDDGTAASGESDASAPSSVIFTPRHAAKPRGFMRTLVPLAILLFCLAALIAHDLFFAGAAGSGITEINGGSPDGSGAAGDDFAEAGTIDPHPHIMLKFDEGHLGKDSLDSMTFAVHKINPDDKTEEPVKLNWYVNGFGNSVVARIDGKDATFGKPSILGGWPKGNETGKPAGKYGGKTRTFEFKDRIQVTQTVTIVPGDPTLVNREYVRHLDVALARYKIKNLDKKKTHRVGLRVLLDTCIGDNDGVPFTLPGVKELVSTQKQFVGPEVPDFVQVLERPDLTNPGTVVQLTMRLSDKLEMPTKFLLTRYVVSDTNDKKSLDRWDVPLRDMKDDSSVVMYWPEKDMKPGDERELAFAYGVGSITSAPSSGGGGKLAVTVGGAAQLRGELTIVALVADPKAKTVTLKLPPGLELIEPPPQTLTQTVGTPRANAQGELQPVPVTWRVRAVSQGAHDISVSTDTKLEQKRRVTITLKSLFN